MTTSVLVQMLVAGERVLVVVVVVVVLVVFKDSSLRVVVFSDEVVTLAVVELVVEVAGDVFGTAAVVVEGVVEVCGVTTRFKKESPVSSERVMLPT